MRKCTAWSVLLHSVRSAVLANGGMLSSRVNQKESRSSATPFIKKLTWRQLRLGVDKPASKPTTECTRKLIFSGLRTRGKFWVSVITCCSARYRLHYASSNLNQFINSCQLWLQESPWITDEILQIPDPKQTPYSLPVFVFMLHNQNMTWFHYQYKE
jgi:hypothetical protein